MGNRIERLLDDVAGVVRPIVGKPKLDVLAYVARTVVVADRARAEHFAKAIPNEGDRAAALADLAAVLAEVDPNSAEHVLAGMDVRTAYHTMLAKLAVAKAVGPANPDRVKRLLKEAERLADTTPGLVQSAVERERRWWAFPGRDLVNVAAAYAAVGDPDRARRLLIRIERACRGPRWEARDADPPEDGKEQRPDGLSLAAIGLATLDPRRAEKTAGSIKHPRLRAEALVDVAAAIAAGDPPNADRIARSVPSRVHDAPMLPTKVVLAMATADPDRAESLARTVPDDFYLGPLLAELAGVHAGTDRANRILADVEGIADRTLHEFTHVTVMIAVAKAVAATDPDRAEGIVAALAEGHNKEGALVDIATAMTAAHPDRAVRIIRSVSDTRRREEAQLAFVTATAAADPDRAEQVARSITDGYRKACALAQVVNGLARGR